MKKKNRADDKSIVYSTDPDFQSGEEEASIEIIPPHQQKLLVRLDTKHRAGKAVTLIEGFKGPEIMLEDLGKKLKTYCGSGGSAKDGVIIIQGDHRDKIIKWLVENNFRKSRKI